MQGVAALTVGFSGYARRVNTAHATAAILAVLMLGNTATIHKANGQSIADVPGVVLRHQPAPSIADLLFGRAVYTASPSIVVLPNGDYVVSDNDFGPGSTADVSGVTYLHRSSDQGQTWTDLGIMTDMKRGSLFAVGNDLYIWGYRASPGDILIRKSTDGGSTWTTPTNTNNGLLRTGNYGGTPSNPVIHDGRAWVAQSGTRIMSAPIGSDLLKSSSWTLSNSANVQSGPLGSGLTVTEAQIVASPQTGVVIMPKVGNLPNSVLIRGNPSNPGQVINPTDDDWINLPGGEKKFGATYDPVSGKFYVLSNPVLDAHVGYTNPALIRNTAAMLSSRDLVHWDMEQIFLYSPNIAYEAFQYLNFDFDGDDMVIASRTAFDVGGNLPPRGHDSNLVTFHKIEDFRTAAPEHKLVISGNEVLRYEVTHHAEAPLGRFAIGATFDGSALSNPDGIGVDAEGDVYIREAGGRILRFDAQGNFIKAVGASPVPLQSSPLQIGQAGPGERAWIGGVSDNWNDVANWYYWGRPDTDYEVANLGSASDKDSFVTVDQPLTLKGIRFRNAHRYFLSGAGSITFRADTGRSLIDADQGNHALFVPVTLSNDTDINVDQDAVISIAGAFNMSGHELFVKGSGQTWVYADFVMNNGTLVLNGDTPINFASSIQITPDGTLEFRSDAGTDLSLGASFTLINGIEHMPGPFDQLALPELAPGLAWDLSTFMSDGIVTIISALTGDLDGDGFVGIGDLNIVLGDWNDNVPPADPRADPSGDGFVGIDDLNLVLGNWNAGTPPIRGDANIPEPGSLVLLIAGLTAGYRRVV